MSVTVNIPDRNLQAVNAASLSDYAEPREKKEGARALLIWLAIIFGIAGFFALWPATRQISFVLLGWWLACVLGFFVVAPALMRRRLRALGTDAQVTSRTQPRLKTLLSKGSALLGIKEPEAFIEKANEFRLQMIGRQKSHFFVVSKTAQETLSEAELNLLTMRALIQARENHVARLNLLAFLNQWQPLLRFLVWPAKLYGTLLGLGWEDAAHQSADRMVLLLKPDEKLLLAAVLKQHLANDPMMQEKQISNTDIDNFLRQGGVLHLEGSEVSTTYKLGSAIHENSTLEERIHAISHWVKAPEFQEAAQKLAAERQKTQKKSPVSNDQMPAQS